MRSIKQNLSKYIMFVVILISATFGVASGAGAAVFKVAETGNVWAVFNGATAGYTNLGMADFSDGPNILVGSPLPAVSNKVNIGTIYYFGYHEKDSIVTFSNYVVNTGETWHSQTDLNVDQFQHFKYEQHFNQNMVPVLHVNWEDLYGGGDRDWNDNTMSFYNVTSAVPEPSTLMMLLIGLGLIPLIKREKV